MCNIVEKMGGVKQPAVLGTASMCMVEMWAKLKLKGGGGGGGRGRGVWGAGEDGKKVQAGHRSFTYSMTGKYSTI